MKTNNELEQKAINTIRFLSADAVAKSEFRSSRPAPMGDRSYWLHNLDKTY